MKIWLIAENWPPRVGGIERYITAIAGGLSERNHTVTVFTSPSPDQAKDWGEVKSVAVTRSKFFWPIVKPAWVPFFLFLFVKSFFITPDVIICGKALFEGRVARLLKKTRNIPYIICTYGMEISTWKSHIKTSTQLSHVLHDANIVLAINQRTREDIINLGAHEERVRIMYPGINPTQLTQMSDAEALLKTLRITKPYILTVARLVARKGIDDLLRACTSIQTHQLIIVGDGPEKNNLKNISQELSSNTIFTGPLSDEDIHALYSRATLFALTPKELPGDYEGFGIVYIEAGYFGLPVVGTNTGGVPEAVLHQKTGILVEPENIPAITSAITSLLDNPEVSAHYGAVSKERVLKEFQWNTIITNLESILTSL
jgi:phosphatidylinositol alpha-1,6-mannosyltransferase